MIQFIRWAFLWNSSCQMRIGCLEESKTDEVKAELKDGILEVSLPEHTKKVNVKQNRDGKVVKNPLFFRD